MVGTRWRIDCDSTFSSFKELEPDNTIDHIFVREGTFGSEHGTL